MGDVSDRGQTRIESNEETRTEKGIKRREASRGQREQGGGGNIHLCACAGWVYLFSLLFACVMGWVGGMGGEE